MFGFFFCEGPVKNFTDATASDTDKFARWHRGMLGRFNPNPNPHPSPHPHLNPYPSSP